MKTTITSNEIIFKCFFFTLIIPKQSSLEFVFYDLRQTIGYPLGLEVKTKNLKFTTIFGKFFYYFYKFIIGYSLNGYSEQARGFNSPTSIKNTNNIKVFLNDLKNNGYNVDLEIKKLNELIGIPIPEKQKPGTTEWNKDKFKLISIIFLVFEILVGSLIFFTEKNSDNSIGSFALLSLMMLIICFAVYGVLTKFKK